LALEQLLLLSFISARIDGIVEVMRGLVLHLQECIRGSTSDLSTTCRDLVHFLLHQLLLHKFLVLLAGLSVILVLELETVDLLKIKIENVLALDNLLHLLFSLQLHLQVFVLPFSHNLVDVNI
jgi:hypothetical protein